MGKNFKMWKMRKKWNDIFGKCFIHLQLVFVVKFENSLRLWRFTKENLVQRNLKTATSESSKFDQNIELVWYWFLSSSFDFPNTLIHFVLVLVIDRTLEHKKIVSHQNHEHNLGRKVTNFFCPELTQIKQKLFFWWNGQKSSWKQIMTVLTIYDMMSLVTFNLLKRLSALEYQMPNFVRNWRVRNWRELEMRDKRIKWPHRGFTFTFWMSWGKILLLD